MSHRVVASGIDIESTSTSADPFAIESGTPKMVLVRDIASARCRSMLSRVAPWGTRTSPAAALGRASFAPADAAALASGGEGFVRAGAGLLAGGGTIGVHASAAANVTTVVRFRGRAREIMATSFRLRDAQSDTRPPRWEPLAHLHHPPNARDFRQRASCSRAIGHRMTAPGFLPNSSGDFSAARDVVPQHSIRCLQRRDDGPAQ